jgi:ankyrin repeat protein
MTLLTLPNELLLIIAEHQDSQHDKNALARTNHRCHGLLNHHLYAYNAKHHAGSALHWGASHGLIRTVQVSLQQGADVESRDDRTDSRPLIESTRLDHADIVALLMEHGANPHATNSRISKDAITIAVVRNKAAVARVLLAQGVDPNYRDWRLYTLLHPAAKEYPSSHEAVARVLIEAGADLESTNALKETPLQIACPSGSVEVARCLIEGGADWRRRDARGKSLLHLASHWNQVEVVRLLVEKGADIEARDDDGCTPLHSACWNGQVETAKMLLDEGADIDARSPKGNTPLILGVLWESTRCGGLKWLLMTSLLLERGADVNRANESNIAPLHCAMSAEDGRLCEMLLLHGADPELRTSAGLTPLHKAVYQNVHGYCSSLEQTKQLLQRGVDVQPMDNEGNTPLHEAAQGDDPLVVGLLLEAGADRSIKNKKGQSPSQLAREWSRTVKKNRERHREVMEMLES